MTGEVLTLRLRPLAATDETFFQGSVLASGETPNFLHDYDPDMNWQDYLTAVDNMSKGVSLPSGYVPCTFLVAVNPDGEIVGRVSIRHHLTDQLAKIGGHIGYVVVPAHRRKGYATALLKQGLTIARDLGIEDVLLTCDADNIGSRKVIEKCGGELSNDPDHQGETDLRYWIRNAET